MTYFAGENNYWQRFTVSRRTALRSAMAASGVFALSLAGCGGDDEKKSDETGPAAAGTGRPGGTLTFQASGATGNTLIGTTPNLTSSRLASLVHSSLYAYDFGNPPSNGVDAGIKPDLAQAMPEQPDETTYVIKLRQANFQNGRAVNAEDVKYSFERLATWPTSNRQVAWAWVDRIEVPDAQTVVIKAKAPYADGIMGMVGYYDAFIVAREFEEGPEVSQKMMGSGPFLWVEDNQPILARLKKNPAYYEKGLPYFDEIVMLENSDKEKQIADFTGRQVDVTFWFPEDGRDRIKAQRPDAQAWSYEYAANNIVPRVDQAPFTDKRVRQALSMSIDQKKIRAAVSKGEGRLDQLFSLALGPKWGFREPSQFGAASKFREFDPQGAKQLLSAAGITQPIETTFHHLEASFAGQAWYDMVTLTVAGWKDLGIANVKDDSQAFTQAVSTSFVGNYDGLAQFPAPMAPNPGQEWKNRLWAPSGGVTVPTQNIGHINDPELSRLIEKQLTQFNFDERKATLKRAEEIMADELYRIPWSTYTTTYFSNPKLKNIVVPTWGYGYSGNYMKDWWFDT